MNIAIYGAGKFGQYALHNIAAWSECGHKVIMLIDNNVSASVCGKPVVSAESFLRDFTQAVDCVFIAVTDRNVQQTLALSLFTKGYRNIYIIHENVYIGKLDIFDEVGKIKSYVKKIQDMSPRLPSVGFKIINTCNLKCKRCIECSNIATEENVLDIDLFIRSLDGLKRKFSGVGYIFIKGGEPFLNPNVEQYVEEARKRFPYAVIRIITNGLLLPKIDRGVFDVIRNCGVQIGVSEYPPTRKMMDQILEIGSENGIEIYIENEIYIEEFEKNLSYTNEDYITAWKNCNDSECHLMANGRIYTCSVMVRNYEWQNYFGLHISEEELEECSADILCGAEDGWEILAKIGAPAKVCKYCSIKPECLPWEISDKHVQKEDWIVKGE